MAGGFIDPYGFSKGATGGGSSKGYVDPYGFSKAPKMPKPPKPHGGGGLFGSIGHLGHFIASKASLAGHDLEGMPGGMYHAARIVNPATFGSDIVTGNIHGLKGDLRNLKNLEAGQVKSAVTSVRHPLRDPFQTAMNLTPGLDIAGRFGEAGLAARAAEGAGESRLGAAAKALRNHETPVRSLTRGEHETSMIPSRNAGVRFVQKGYDKVVQNAMDKEAQAQGTGRLTAHIASHGAKRIGGALAEEQRAVQRMNAIPADKLERSALKLSKMPLKAGSKLHSAAMELTSTQTSPEDAAFYHEQQAQQFAKQASAATDEKQIQRLTEAAKRNEGASELYRKVGEKNLVHTDLSRPDGEKVYINPNEKRLAATDAALKRAGNAGEGIIQQHNLMSQEGQEARINAPGRVRAGAEYVKPTPGRLGKESPVLQEARRQLAAAEKGHAKAALRAMGNTNAASVMAHAQGLDRPYMMSPEVQRLSGAVSFLKDRVQHLEQLHSNRVEPTGLLGGKEALPGRNFVPNRSSEKVAESAPVSVSQGKTIGEAKSPIDKKSFTGENIRQGRVPKNVALSTAQHYRQLAKFENTFSLRRSILDHDAAPLKRSADDILIRKPGGGAKPLSEEMKQVLGMARAASHDKASLDEINAGTQEGLDALHSFLNQHILDRAADSKASAIGTSAPDGYAWVNSHLTKTLQEDAMPKARGAGGKIGAAFDNTNSAITAATVYFKVGHSFTRAFTNAATNIIQGSARPDETAKSFALWKKLSDEDKARAISAGGQQGFAALPHEGSAGAAGQAVSGIARGGSRFWARHFDTPFRFNSVAYELRRIGYGTPEKFHDALDAIQNNGKGMPAHEWSKVSAAFRRADREAISYDRLNDFEKRFLARGIWFYPWVKGSSVFTVRSMLEHPYKMAALGNLGVKGRKEQLKGLGPVPSYEQGLIDIGKGKQPKTVDMSTFSPFSTLGQLLNIPKVHGSIAQQLNPALSAGVQYATGDNQYGEPSNTPGKDSLKALFASTPEAQILEQALAKNAKGKKGSGESAHMFPDTNVKSEIERFLGGPGLISRRVNKKALAKAAARENAKRYTVYSNK